MLNLLCHFQGKLGATVLSNKEEYLMSASLSIVACQWQNLISL